MIRTALMLTVWMVGVPGGGMEAPKKNTKKIQN